MDRLISCLAAFGLLVVPIAAPGQVVETDPDLPRTDNSVTVYFNADEGTGGLADYNGDVYAHTGISTDQNGDQEWKCVKNHWPTSTDFSGNRSDTKLTKVSTNRYKLVISDIRAYYQNTSTSCTLGADETIQTMNFVFRNADGSNEGKAEGGADIFVEVADVAGGESFVGASITAPQGNPPLYPFIVSKDTTVTVSIEADTANVESIARFDLVVDGDTVQTGTADSLGYDLTTNSVPNDYDVEAIAVADTGSGTISDTSSTVLIRTPDVTTQSRPPGTKDGINYNGDGTVTLSLNAPNKDFAYVVGEFTNWEIDPNYFMKKDGDHWWITLNGLSSGTEYAFQYFVDGEHRIADPFSHKVLTPNDQYISSTTYPNLKPYPASETEGFVSTLETGQSDFNFDNPNFTPPPQDQMVVYELLIRDFLEQGDFQTLTDTLDYLDRLGVNAIELMPVAEFAGNNSWGYNPTFHFALDKAYGPREEFKKFVQAAHNRGMAVIMDVVYNHIDSQSPLRQLYGSAAESPFLESGPNRGICGAFFEELNQSNPFIQNYIDRANKYWVEEFNVDGFRYDLAKCIADGSGDPVTGWKDVADYVWDTVDGGSAPYTYMILEFFGTNAQEQELANYRDSDAGGMASWQNLNEQYNQASMGYVDDNSNIESAFFGFANFNDPTYIPYMESHDEQWLMQRNAQFGNSSSNGYDVKELQTALDRQKLVGTFFFTLPGPRMTWQFAELGYGFKPDECLEDDGNSNICSSQAPGRTQPKPIRWEYRDPQQSPGRVDLYETWQALLRLRNDNPELFAKDPGTGNSEQGILMSAATGEQIRCLRLRDENLDATIIGNFGVTSFPVTLGVANGTACSFSETGTWYNFFEDKSLQVNGDQNFQLRPGEFRIYTSKEEPAPPMGLVPSAPAHRESQSVSSDGAKDFGTTGIDINFSGVGTSSGTVTVEKLDEPPLNTGDVSESNTSDYRFVIEADGGLSFDDQTEVRFDVGTLEGVTDPSTVTVYSRSTEDTGTLTEIADVSYDSGANEIVAKTGSFSEFVLASNTQGLPVELAGFDATLTGSQTVRLSWQTTSETNNAGFQVQRRQAGAGSWTEVDFVEGAGTTEEAQTYRFTDAVPFAADSMRYRLKQVDADGSTQLSDPVTVAMGPPDRLTLRAPFPNPVRGQATIRYAVPERQDVSLVLFDVLGRQVRTLTRSPQKGRHERQLDVSGLSSGAYILRLRGENSVETRRITVVK